MTDSPDVGLARAAAAVAAALRANGETLALAESCTAGMIAAALGGIAGASGFFWGGVIVYSEDAKHRLAGVDRELIRAAGLVSAPTAAALAAGIRRRSGATYGLSVTGWAGPDAGPGEEVGRVFAAVADEDGVRGQDWLLPGDRNAVRSAAAWHGLELLRRHLGATEDDGDD